MFNIYYNDRIIVCDETAGFVTSLNQELTVINQLKRDVLVKTLSGTSPPQDGKYVVHFFFAQK